MSNARDVDVWARDSSQLSFRTYCSVSSFFFVDGDDIRDDQKLLGGRILRSQKSPRLSPAAMSGNGDYRQRALRFTRLNRSLVEEQLQTGVQQ